MYKIIGADNNEYGPVSAEQLREWIAQGRVGPQTQVQAEGGEWKPASSLPEFAEAFMAQPTAGANTPQASKEDILQRDYALDIGSCFTRSWGLVMKNFWPVVGVSFLILLVQGAINQALGLFSRPAVTAMIEQHEFTPGGIAIVLVVSLLSTPVYLVLMAGLLNYYLKLIRGEAPTMGEAFAGFSSALPQLVLLGLVSGFLSLLGFCLCVLPGIYLSVAWIFSTALVIDRRMNFWEAMEFSRRVVSKHWFTVLALLIVVALVSAAGVIACCIGILVTIPIGTIALMYAYEDIFRGKAP